MKKLLLSLFFLLYVSSLPAFAQWQIIEPTLIGNKANLTAGGSLIYRDGVLWAGYSQLFRSSDQGDSWQAIPPFFQQGNWITDINFFDRNNGLVSTFDDGVYQTTDGGATWKHILVLQYILSSCYGQTVQDVICFESAPATPYVSHDGGGSWKATVVNDFGRLIRRSPEGVIYAITADQNNIGSFFLSPDNGDSWTQRAGRFDGDSYSFGFDSCVHKLFVVNEDVLSRTDNFSQIFASTDDASSFQVSVQEDIEYFTGSIAVSPNATHCQTFRNGVLRTTDHGATWESIGGPNGILDASFLTAINDEVLIGLDEKGQLWRTTNSGGKPIVKPEPLSLSKTILFANDTATECSPILDTLILTSALCNGKMLAIEEAYIEGASASDYSIVYVPKFIPSTGERIIVQYAPVSGVNGPARFILMTTEGYDTILLDGYGIPKREYSLFTEDKFTDVIGDSLSIPITTDALQSGQMSLRIRFDPNYLIYQGAYDGNGVQLTDTYVSERERVLQIPGSNLAGNSRHLADLQFLYFPEDASPTRVEIVALTGREAVCGDFTDTVATISTSPGCELPILSQFLRYKRFPSVSIHPNPARNNITVRGAINESVELQLRDVLGTCVWQGTGVVSGAGLVIPVGSLPPGAYDLEVRGAEGGTLHLPVIVER